MTEPNDILGKWNYGSTPQFPYGDETSYKKAMEYLDGPYIIEDWGCGTAWARKFVERGRYIGVDGSWSMHCDTVADLRTYKSTPDAILLRHVLDHNYEWGKILKNALESFQKKMVIVLFTPFSEETRSIGMSFGCVPDLSFRKEDLLAHVRPYLEREESIKSETQYGGEHMFYLRRP